MSVREVGGDGVSTDLVDVTMALPNANGGLLTIEGKVRKVGQTLNIITGSPLSLPRAPLSGSIYYVVQVDYSSNTATSGVVSIKQSTSGYPSADASNMIVFQQQLGTADINPGADVKILTPD
jgi:hypothetical protein